MPLPHRCLAVVSLLALLGGCKDEPEPSGPELSETPLWQVKADPDMANECFGSSVALADFDGDGRKDLAVGTEPCQVRFIPAQHPGRVSFFAGQERFFSTQAVSALMTWQNTHPRTSGQNLRVVAGNMNGDAYADLLVHGRYGASVFLGGPDLGAILAEPAFRVPGNGLFLNVALADLNGDGLDDLINTAVGGLAFYLATPGASSGHFTLAQRRLSFAAVLPVGDLNGDGADDLLMNTADGEREGVFLGCKPDSAFACDGPLSAEPLWSVDSVAFGDLVSLHPDLSGDGRPEGWVLTGNGVMHLHLSSAEGGLSPTPVWSTQMDPAFPGMGGATVVGDLDGDGRSQDFVLRSTGRLYFYSPREDVSQALAPVWAWPREDSIPDGYEAYRRYSVAVPGDLDGDGIDDLVVANTASGDILSTPVGDVAVYGGGRVPKQPREAPYLAPLKTCGLNVDPVNGKPDLTVDQGTISRTLHVVRKTFSADSCEVQEACVGGPGERRLLRFSAALQNLGSAPIIMPSMEERPDLYVFDPCHGHDHVDGFAGYELRDASGDQVLTGRKQGYVLVDSLSFCEDAAPQNLFYEPMGISPGWADIYTFDVPCQWVDVTGLANGVYTLNVSVDTHDIIEEQDVLPNVVSVRLRLEGDTATVLP